MHADATTCLGVPFADFIQEPCLEGNTLRWKTPASTPLDEAVLATIEKPFATEGGIRVLTGNLGRSVIKVSAVEEAHWRVKAPAVVIDSQHALQQLFEAGDLDQSCVVVVRYQGPSANGMPELHKLTPILGILQDRGHEVALVTDGRMSGASGKVPAAIHLTPEAALDGPISKLNTGDIIELDAYSGTLNVELPEAELTQRPPTKGPDSNGSVGRSFFDAARRGVGNAEQGASFLFPTKGDR